MSNNICKEHEADFSDIVSCNNCNMISGFMLKSKDGAIFQLNDRPNLWPTEKLAHSFAKKYSIAKSWKPIRVYIHFE